MTTQLRSIQYHAVVYSPDANGGPGARKAELDAGLLNVAWQGYMNLPSRCAFTLLRKNKVLDSIIWMQDHIKVFREHPSTGVKTVFSGKLVKPSFGNHDVVVLAWDYASLLQRSRTGLNVQYPTKLVGTEIISPEWTLAKNVSNSPLAFVATGTIEDPLALDGVTKIKTNASFGVNEFSRLFAFNALAEMSMANTTNNVVFEITRDAPHTFNFWKNRGALKTNYAFDYPGVVLDHFFEQGFDAYVNDLAAIVNDPTTGAPVEYAATTADVATTAYRRLQDTVVLPTLMGLSTGTTETDQVKAGTDRQLTVRSRIVPVMSLTPTPGYYHPYDGHDLGDMFRLHFANSDRSGALYDANARLIGINAAWQPDAGELAQLWFRSVP